jgi:hypothetical protein
MRITILLLSQVVDVARPQVNKSIATAGQQIFLGSHLFLFSYKPAWLDQILVFSHKQSMKMSDSEMSQPPIFG